MGKISNIGKTHLFLFITFIAGLTFFDNTHTADIVTSDGKEFKLSQQEVTLFPTLKQAQEYHLDQIVPIPLPNITSQAWEVLYPFIKLALDNKVENINNELMKFSVKEIINLINIIDYLGSDELPKVFIGGLAHKLIHITSKLEETDLNRHPDIMYIQNNLQAQFLKNLTIKLALISGKAQKIIFPQKMNVFHQLLFNPKLPLLAFSCEKENQDIIKIISRAQDNKTYEEIIDIPSTSRVQFSVDGTFACIDNHTNILIYNLHTNKLIKKISNYNSYVHNTAFHPDKNLLAIKYDPDVIEVQNLQSGTILHTLKDFQGISNQLLFNQDGTFLLSKVGRSDDNKGYITSWNTDTGKTKWSFKSIASNNIITSMKLTPHDQLLILLADGTLELRNMQDGTLCKKINIAPQNKNIGFYTATFGTKDNLLAIGSDNNTITIFDFPMLTTVTTFSIYDSNPPASSCSNINKGSIINRRSIAFHPSELLLSEAKINKNIVLYDWQPYINMNLTDLLKLLSSKKK